MRDINSRESKANEGCYVKLKMWKHSVDARKCCLRQQHLLLAEALRLQEAPRRRAILPCCGLEQSCAYLVSPGATINFLKEPQLLPLTAWTKTDSVAATAVTAGDALQKMEPCSLLGASLSSMMHTSESSTPRKSVSQSRRQTDTQWTLQRGEERREMMMWCYVSN